MRFTKMHGAGNDYIYVSCFDQPCPENVPELARAVSDRHRGIGADGLILICPSEVADARMRMWNADGSEAEMCGNGIRCVAKYVYERGIARRNELCIETGRGILSLQLEVKSGRVERVRVNMGQPILDASAIPTRLTGSPPMNVPLKLRVDAAHSEIPSPHVTCISMGNPHCVLFVDELTDATVNNFGPTIELHSSFPQRVNVEFAQVLSRREVRVRVWERGSGETLACGTGACAVAVAGVLTNRLDRAVLAHLPGGDLELEWAKDGDVFLTGPAVEVFSGEWSDRAVA